MKTYADRLKALATNVFVVVSIPVVIALVMTLRGAEVKELTAAPDDPSHSGHCVVCNSSNRFSQKPPELATSVAQRSRPQTTTRPRASTTPKLRTSPPRRVIAG